MSSPFGIEFYSDISALQVIQDLGVGLYILMPPTPHPLLETYVVRSTASLGVVSIRGVGAVIENDKFGDATRAAVDRLANQLISRYQGARKQDDLRFGSIWNEPEDWLSGLINNERYYSYFWHREHGACLPDDLESVLLCAAPHEGFGATVILEYTSVKASEAEAELELTMAELL